MPKETYDEMSNRILGQGFDLDYVALPQGIEASDLESSRQRLTAPSAPQGSAAPPPATSRGGDVLSNLSEYQVLSPAPLSPEIPTGQQEMPASVPEIVDRVTGGLSGVEPWAPVGDTGMPEDTPYFKAFGTSLTELEALDAGRLMVNLLPSAVKNIGNILGAAGSPIDTTYAIYDLLQGAHGMVGKYLAPTGDHPFMDPKREDFLRKSGRVKEAEVLKNRREEEQRKRDFFLFFLSEQKKRLGRDFRKTLIEDPFSIVLDIIPISKAFAMAGRIPAVSKIARNLAPTNLAGQVVKGVLRGGETFSRVANERIFPVLTGLTSGVTSPPVKLAAEIGRLSVRAGAGAKNSALFKAYRTGKKEIAEIVTNARKNYRAIVTQAKNKYTDMFNKLPDPDGDLGRRGPGGSTIRQKILADLGTKENITILTRRAKAEIPTKPMGFRTGPADAAAPRGLPRYEIERGSKGTLAEEFPNGVIKLDYQGSPHQKWLEAKRPMPARGDVLDKKKPAPREVSSVNMAAEKRLVEKMVTVVYDWDDFSKVGLRNLYQRLEKVIDRVNPKSNPGRIGNRMVKTVKDHMEAKIPGFTAMQGELSKMHVLRKEVEGFVGKPDQYGAFPVDVPGTLEKLVGIFTERAGSPFRRATVEKMEQIGGEMLLAPIAGVYLKDWFSSGLYGRTQVFGALGRVGAVAATGAAISPLALLALPFTSPRVVGAFAHGLGIFHKHSIGRFNGWVDKLKELSDKSPEVFTEGMSIGAVVDRLLQAGEEVPHLPDIRMRQKDKLPGNLGAYSVAPKHVQDPEERVTSRGDVVMVNATEEMQQSLIKNKNRPFWIDALRDDPEYVHADLLTQREDAKRLAGESGDYKNYPEVFDVSLSGIFRSLGIPVPEAEEMRETKPYTPHTGELSLKGFSSHLANFSNVPFNARADWVNFLTGMRSLGDFTWNDISRMAYSMIVGGTEAISSGAFIHRVLSGPEGNWGKRMSSSPESKMFKLMVEHFISEEISHVGENGKRHWAFDKPLTDKPVTSFFSIAMMFGYGVKYAPVMMKIYKKLEGMARNGNSSTAAVLASRMMEVLPVMIAKGTDDLATLENLATLIPVIRPQMKGKGKVREGIVKKFEEIFYDSAYDKEVYIPIQNARVARRWKAMEESKDKTNPDAVVHPGVTDPNLLIGLPEDAVFYAFDRYSNPTSEQLINSVKEFYGIFGEKISPASIDRMKTSMTDLRRYLVDAETLARRSGTDMGSWYREIGKGLYARVGDKNAWEAESVYSILSPQYDTERNMAAAFTVMLSLRKLADFLPARKLDGSKNWTEPLVAGWLWAHNQREFNYLAMIDPHMKNLSAEMIHKYFEGNLPFRKYLEVVGDAVLSGKLGDTLDKDRGKYLAEIVKNMHWRTGKKIYGEEVYDVSKVGGIDRAKGRKLPTKAEMVASNILVQTLRGGRTRKKDTVLTPDQAKMYEGVIHQNPDYIGMEYDRYKTKGGPPTRQVEKVKMTQDQAAKLAHLYVTGEFRGDYKTTAFSTGIHLGVKAEKEGWVPNIPISTNDQNIAKLFRRYDKKGKLVTTFSREEYRIVNAMVAESGLQFGFTPGNARYAFDAARTMESGGVASAKDWVLGKSWTTEKSAVGHVVGEGWGHDIGSAESIFAFSDPALQKLMPFLNKGQPLVDYLEKPNQRVMDWQGFTHISVEGTHTDMLKEPRWLYLSSKQGGFSVQGVPGIPYTNHVKFHDRLFGFLETEAGGTKLKVLSDLEPVLGFRHTIDTRVRGTYTGLEPDMVLKITGQDPHNEDVPRFLAALIGDSFQQQGAVLAHPRLTTVTEAGMLQSRIFGGEDFSVNGAMYVSKSSGRPFTDAELSKISDYAAPRHAPGSEEFITGQWSQEMFNYSEDSGGRGLRFYNIIGLTEEADASYFVRLKDSLVDFRDEAGRQLDFRGFTARTGYFDGGENGKGYKEIIRRYWDRNVTGGSPGISGDSIYSQLYLPYRRAIEVSVQDGTLPRSALDWWDISDWTTFRGRDGSSTLGFLNDTFGPSPMAGGAPGSP